MFTAVALVLKMNEMPIILYFNMTPIFLYLNISINALGVMLRKITIEEWKSYEDEYQCLLTFSTVAEEADKFMHSGYYHDELADTTPKILSNALM